jgi:predicted metal-dependent HD superfamily phosphohydrolase
VEYLLVTLGADPGAARSVSDELRARYAEAHRRYHTLEHVREVLAEINRLLLHELEADPVAMVLAAWFHDAIYDVNVGSGESEQASADLVLDRLPALDATDRDVLAEEIARLVRLTAGHRCDRDDRSGAVLIDADLWILSAGRDRYDRYVADVRAEYAHVPDDAWTAGRGDVVRQFLARSDELYVAGPDVDRRARRTRATDNLRRELQGLGR